MEDLMKVDDALMSILLKVDPSDLDNTCKTSRKFYRMCHNKYFLDEYENIWHLSFRQNYFNNVNRGLRRAAFNGYEDLFDYFISKGANSNEILYGSIENNDRHLIDYFYTEIPHTEPSDEIISRMIALSGDLTLIDYLKTYQKDFHFYADMAYEASIANGDLKLAIDLIENYDLTNEDILKYTNDYLCPGIIKYLINNNFIPDEYAIVDSPIYIYLRDHNVENLNRYFEEIIQETGDPLIIRDLIIDGLNWCLNFMDFPAQSIKMLCIYQKLAQINFKQYFTAAVILHGDQASMKALNCQEDWLM